MRRIQIFAWLTLAFASLVQLTAAGDDLQSVQMVDQARQWQRKNRDDLAADVWRRLLLIDPKHAEAIVKLGSIEAHAGNLAEAEALYDRAAQLAPRPPGLKELSAALDAAKPAAPNKLSTQSTLQEPRKPAAIVTKVRPVEPVASVPVTPAAAPPRPKVSARALIPAARPASSSKGGTSPTSPDNSQLILSNSLDLGAVKPGQ
jgi:tetratricopeptide (TPR) repeat protein